MYVYGLAITIPMHLPATIRYSCYQKRIEL